MTAPQDPRAEPRRGLGLGLAAFVIAFNLRPALTSVGPLLAEITAGAGLGAAGAAWLTTVPVFCLGVGGGLAPWIMGRIGIDRGILAGVAVLTLGLALRGLAEAVSLYVGTVLAGLGIGLTGVLLPALVKRDFGSRAGRMTALYTTVLCVGAALGTALSVPLREAVGLGWAPALAVWAGPEPLAALAWLPFARRRTASEAASAGPGAPRTALLRDPVAWQVTGFMGLQSSLAYVQFGWLPSLLAGRGAGEAGALTALVILGQAPGALAIGHLAGRSRDQRAWIAVTILGSLTGFLMLVLGPGWIMIPAVLLLGVTGGAAFSLGLILIVLRARDARDAGTLSAMAQGIGYTLASLGPLGFGLAHEATGRWDLSILLFAGLCLSALLCGLGAGRDRTVA